MHPAARVSSSDIRRFAANYQVPFDETVRRINRINELMKLSAAELHSQWQNSNELELLIRWGFTLPDIAIRRALLTAAAAFGDKRSEGLLRDFLLMREQDDELKRNAIAALAAMGAKLADNAIRFSLSRYNTIEEAQQVCEAVNKIVKGLRR